MVYSYSRTESGVKRSLVLWLVGSLLFTVAPAFGEASPSPAPAAAPTPAKPAPQPAMSKEEKAEDDLGKAAAEELEKQAKVIKESPELPRLQRIIGELTPHSQRPNVKYQVKVLDLNAINAFCLPGGRIYVTKGTLAAVESDDELTAILGHEMAHNALRHPTEAAKRNAKFSKKLGALVI